MSGSKDEKASDMIEHCLLYEDNGHKWTINAEPGGVVAYCLICNSYCHITAITNAMLLESDFSSFFGAKLSILDFFKERAEFKISCSEVKFSRLLK